MTAPDHDVDHENSYMREAFVFAREAAARGDLPFGSVLVRDGSVVMGDSNHVHTNSDIRHHPELHLAYRACREMSGDERADTVMYTSTEPCPMCAGGLARAGFERIVYSVSSDEISAYRGTEPRVRAATILEGISDVIGPVLNDEGRKIHDDFGW